MTQECENGNCFTRVKLFITISYVLLVYSGRPKSQGITHVVDFPSAFEINLIAFKCSGIPQCYNLQIMCYYIGVVDFPYKVLYIVS